MRNELYKVWGEDVNLTQNYGMSELMGPGVSGECLELKGMHINEDHFIAEVIDSATGRCFLPAKRRAGHHLHFQGGAASHPLPYQGYYQAYV